MSLAMMRGIPRLGIFFFAISIIILLFWSLHGTVYFRNLTVQDHANPSKTASAPEGPATAKPTPPTTWLSTQYHGSHDEYWNAVFRALEDARPHCPPIDADLHGLDDSQKEYAPLDSHKPHPHNINMTDTAEKELMRAHYRMRRAAFELGQNLPYVEETAGIVVTASPKQLPYLLVSLRMLRKTGSQLPVELFLADESEYNADMCDEALPALNTRCVVMSPIFAPKIDHFQYKVFAMLLSSFQNVLFLDADAFPVHDPAPLFKTRPYTSHGMITWPDNWANTVSAHYYHIAGIPEVPVATRRASETGQIMLDKSRHQESLLMTVYYNYHGPSHYYNIFSQASHGPGDKDTFIQGAMAVDMPFYSVKTSLDKLGQRGDFWMAFAQRDPAEDFLYGPPMPNHIHEKDAWEDGDVDGAKGSSDNATPPKPRVMVVHQMAAKIQPNIILQDGFPSAARPDNVPTFKKTEGGWQRMWTSVEDVEKTFGWDAEYALWEILEQMSCLDKVQPEACQKLKEYRAAVFGT